MHPKDIQIEHFNYTLPSEKIAQFPLAERDLSKLLVYKNEQIETDCYANIAQYIPSSSLLVFNETKVIQARLFFQKSTGGIIELFCLEPHSQYGDIQVAMLQKNTIVWQCLVGGAAKWKDNQTLTASDTTNNLTVTAKIKERFEGYFHIEFSWNNDFSFAEVLHSIGNVPLPPYLNRKAETDDKDRYQTVYAKQEGSVAAPTAGLHFTQRIFESFSSKNITTDYLTLHVGAGTFKPVKSTTLADHDMHAEWIVITQDNLKKWMATDQIIAVGTTSLRTLESTYWIGVQLLHQQEPFDKEFAVGQWTPYEFPNHQTDKNKVLHTVLDYMKSNQMDEIMTKTQILIAPGYQFRMIQGLITNFHQPQSTLLLLIAALIGDSWKKVYDYALNNNFRFLSFGDGSLLWNHQQNQL